MRERPKPRYPLLSDSSSCGGDDNSEHNHNATTSAASEAAIEAAADRVRRLDLDQRGRDTAKGVVAGPWEPCQSGQPEDQADGRDSEEVVRGEKVKKKSFWQKLLGKKSNKES